MRIAASTVLLGTASAASFPFLQDQAQHVLGGPESMKPIVDEAANGFKGFGDQFKGMTEEAKALWDEVKMLVGDAAFEKPSWFSPPKPHKRRPDSEWDHIVKGAEVQKVWVEDEEGSHRQVGGRLEDFNLRVKTVDPSKLGVDTVKQFSGYLDDEANDKHLFYCTYNPARERAGVSKDSKGQELTPSCRRRVLRVSQ